MEQAQVLLVMAWHALARQTALTGVAGAVVAASGEGADGLSDTSGVAWSSNDWWRCRCSGCTWHSYVGS